MTFTAPYKEALIRNYSGYKLTQRQLVLDQLEKRGVKALHPRVVLEHITHQFPSSEVAPAVKSVKVVASADDDGVQALLVEVDGSTRRGDGGFYHITFSLSEDRKPVESNKLIKINHQKGTLKYLDSFEIKVKPF